MKIAIACDGTQVSGHFGHCEAFTIFEADDNKITGSQTLPNPGHKPGFLPVFLQEQGANVIISGGMGAGAVELFNQNGIKVITGASGDARAAAEGYLAGTLVSTGSICTEHQHEGSCGH